MKEFVNNKHLVNKLVELLKYALTLIVLYFLVLKAPNEISNLVTIIAGFVLGGSKLPSKIGF